MGFQPLPALDAVPVEVVFDHHDDVWIPLFHPMCPSAGGRGAPHQPEEYE